MTSPPPPKLAVALLDRLVADTALIGDLIEEFRTGRSRLWFWRQALYALLIDSSRPAREVRGLKLGKAAAWYPSPNSRAISRNCYRPVPDVGGFGLIALGILMTATLPELWWFVLYGATGGAVFAMVTIRKRRAYDSGDTAEKEAL